MSHRKKNSKSSKSKKSSTPEEIKLADPFILPPPTPQFTTICLICGTVHDQSSQHHFEYTEEVNDDLMCEICMQPLVDPVDTPCRHTFCFICLANHTQLRQSCPIDRTPLGLSESGPSSVIIRRMVGKLLVTCPNRVHCRKVLPRASLESHLKSCPGTLVFCPKRDQGCLYSSPQCLMEHHLWSCLQTLGMYASEIPPGVETWIEIPSGCSTPLGLSIIGGSDSRMKSIMIQSIDPSGTAAKDGRLKPGDTIMEIEGRSSSLMNFTEASHYLLSSVPLVRLKVLRGVEQDLKAVLDDADIEVVELSRSGDNNTFKLELGKHQSLPGVFVRDMDEPVLNKGELCLGDRILDVDGHDTRYLTIDEIELLFLQTVQIAKLLVARVPEMMRIKIHTGLLDSNEVDSIQIDTAYEEIPNKSYKAGDTKTVVLQKQDDEFFGMNVAGGMRTPKGDLPVFISGIREGGVIDKCPYIQRGDIIMSINNHNLMQKTHEDAVEIIKTNVTATSVQLKLVQGEPDVPDPGLSPLWTRWLDIRTALGPDKEVVLTKDQDLGLGFSIVGGKDSPLGDCPLYIQKILDHSIAGLDGRLCVGDVITSINNIPVHDWTQQETVSFFKKCQGNLFIRVLVKDYLDESKASSL